MDTINKQQLSIHIENWVKRQRAIALNTRQWQHCDKVKSAIELLYAHHNLSAPKLVWCRGPLDMLEQSGSDTSFGAAATGWRSLPPFHHQLFTLPLAAWLNSVQATIAQSVFDRTKHLIMQEHVLKSARWAGTALRNAEQYLAYRYVTYKVHERLQSFVCPQWMLETHLAAFILSDLTGQSKSEIGQALLILAESGGMLFPNETICFVCSPPNTLETDGNGFLHNSNGAALTFADDLACYSWHGQALHPIVERSIINNPASITMEQLESARSHAGSLVMINRYGPKRFLEDTKGVEKDRADIKDTQGAPAEAFLYWAEARNSSCYLVELKFANGHSRIVPIEPSWQDGKLSALFTNESRQHWLSPVKSTKLDGLL